MCHVNNLDLTNITSGLWQFPSLSSILKNPSKGMLGGEWSMSNSQIKVLFAQVLAWGQLTIRRSRRNPCPCFFPPNTQRRRNSLWLWWALDSGQRCGWVHLKYIIMLNYTWSSRVILKILSSHSKWMKVLLLQILYCVNMLSSVNKIHTLVKRDINFLSCKNKILTKPVPFISILHSSFSY